MPTPSIIEKMVFEIEKRLDNEYWLKIDNQIENKDWNNECFVYLCDVRAFQTLSFLSSFEELNKNKKGVLRESVVRNDTLSDSDNWPSGLLDSI